MSEENKNTEFDNSFANNNEASSQPVQNSDFGDNASAKEATPPPYRPPVNYGQTGYTAYGANHQYASYTPYGTPKPEAPQKPSKGKKKGAAIAAIIICAVLVLSVAVVGIVFIAKDNPFNNKESVTGDDSQLNLADMPEKSEQEAETDGPLTSGQVYNKVYESSVGIIVYTGNRQTVASEGSGIVMGLTGDGKSTYIVTCAHVVNVQSPKVLVQTHDGEQYDAVVVGIDSKTDIGLLRVETTDLKAAEFANSDSLSVGDTVYAIGNPGGTQFFGSFTNGMVSAIGRPVDSPVGYEVPCIQHTAAINPGNSGGALVNEYGQIVGINSSKIASTEYEGMGFAVPSVTVKEIVDELIKNGAVTSRPALGIKFAPVYSSQVYSIIARANNLPAGSVIIDSISASSDLNNQNVKSGDMILAVNGQDLESYETLLDVVENGKIGDTIKLKIGRVDADYNVTTFEVEVKLISDATVTSEQNSETQSYNFPFNR